MGKHFVFRNYWWIAAAVALIAIVVIVASGSPGRESLIATTLAAALGFCYFVQKQKLDELRLFKDLFTDFNRRYDEMNDKLENIRGGNGPGGAGVKNTLVEYFNLCAEEYLFFREGYIHPEAWQSWCRGMVYYLQHKDIRRVWEEEMISGSYYDLTLRAIEHGAAKHKANI
jgi:hypothetical protein